jgi:large subunit ribosomal protein L30
VNGQIKITLRRSAIGSTPKQRAVLRGLGLRRINSSVLRPDDSAIRGMVRKVIHLVEVQEVPAGGGSREPRAESRDEVKAAGGRGDEAA